LDYVLDRGWSRAGGRIAVAQLNPIINGLVYELSHTDWQGLRFYDLIWPSFMLMTGMSLAFSYAKRSLTQTHNQIFMRVLRRLPRANRKSTKPARSFKKP
jgi:predicted acyltransferase